MAQRKENRVSLRLTDEEYEELKNISRKCGYGTAEKSGCSTYAKAVVMGHNPPSVFKHEVVGEICTLHARLGNAVGLLKLALSEDKGGNELKVYISEILRTQKQVKDLIRDIRDGDFLE